MKAAGVFESWSEFWRSMGIAIALALPLWGLAASGVSAWDAGWTKSDKAFTKHLADTAPTVLASLKTKARKAGR